MDPALPPAGGRRLQWAPLPLTSPACALAVVPRSQDAGRVCCRPRSRSTQHSFPAAVRGGPQAQPTLSGAGADAAQSFLGSQLATAAVCFPQAPAPARACRPAWLPAQPGCWPSWPSQRCPFIDPLPPLSGWLHHPPALPPPAAGAAGLPRQGGHPAVRDLRRRHPRHLCRHRHLRGWIQRSGLHAWRDEGMGGARAAHHNRGRCRCGRGRGPRRGALTALAD